MLSKVRTAIENAHSLEWAGRQDGLMMQKDNIICACVKILIKEEEIALR